MVELQVPPQACCVLRQGCHALRKPLVSDIPPQDDKRSGMGWRLACLVEWLLRGFSRLLLALRGCMVWLGHSVATDGRAVLQRGIAKRCAMTTITTIFTTSGSRGRAVLQRMHACMGVIIYRHASMEQVSFCM